MATLRTALVVPVPEAAAAVDEWRERTCNAKPSAGVPPHVTLAVPFVPPAEVDDALLTRLRELFGAAPRFGFELAAAGRFPGAVYLAPEPAGPFIRLKERIHAEYPDYPLYGDPSLTYVPHLTVAEGHDETLDAAEAGVLASLPLQAEAREVVLLAETQPSPRRWRALASFPLG